MAKTVKVTYEEVARRARVSISTVSRIANGNPRVDPKIQERVKRAATTLGAELRGRRKSKTLAFILSNREMLHPFHSHILAGAEAAAAACGYNMLYLSFRYTNSERGLDLPPILQNPEQVSGFILAGTNSPNLLSLLCQRRIPFVVMGNNVLGEWDAEQYDVVWFDDVHGASEATEYLQSLGHRDIWYVGNSRMPWYALRYQGYARAMENAGFAARMSDVDSADDRQLGYLATKSILSRNEPMSAIFAGGDSAAQGVCRALRERGLRIPEDVSVAGFTDTEAANWHPPLTTVRIFTDQVSKRMIELLVNRVTHPELAPQRFMVPTQLIKRESCDRVGASAAVATG